MMNGLHVGRAGWAWGRCVGRMTGIQGDAIHQSWFKWLTLQVGHRQGDAY